MRYFLGLGERWQPILLPEVFQAPRVLDADSLHTITGEAAEGAPASVARLQDSPADGHWAPPPAHLLDEPSERLLLRRWSVLAM